MFAIPSVPSHCALAQLSAFILFLSVVSLSPDLFLFPVLFFPFFLWRIVLPSFPPVSVSLPPSFSFSRQPHAVCSWDLVPFIHGWAACALMTEMSAVGAEKSLAGCCCQSLRLTCEILQQPTVIGTAVGSWREARQLSSSHPPLYPKPGEHICSRR